MALTKAQEMALYQILEVPYVSKAYRIQGQGLLVDETDKTTDPYAAKTKIDERLTEIAADADLETELTSLLDDWIDLGTDVTRIDAGNVGNVGGVTDDPNEERDELRRRVLIIVPCWRCHEVLQRNAPRSVPLIGNG